MITTLSVKPRPDFDRLRRVLCREGEPDRVPFFEIHGQVEERVLEVLGEAGASDPAVRPRWWPGLKLRKRDGIGAIGEQPAETPATLRTGDERWELLHRQHFKYMHLLGYDYVNVIPQLEFPHVRTLSEDNRAYVQTELHEIAGWDEFERYPWPDMSQVDYSCLQWAEDHLPEGMKVVVHYEGPYIKVLYLLGYLGLSYLLADERELVRRVFDEVGKRLVQYFDICASFDSVGAMMCADDIAYRTGTVISPADLREFAFPWHNEIAAVVHRHGKPIMLHACGNIEAVMEDVIACGYDARHSFEDVITPVWEAKERWGDRIAMLGGFDMHKLCTMTPEEVRQHTRFLMETCAPGGGYALGTGNSVANYVPVENFLAMIDEGLRNQAY